MSGILKFVKTSQASSFRQSPKAIKRIQPTKVDKRASIPTSDKKYKVNKIAQQIYSSIVPKG